MKKILAALLVLALVAPAMADVAVTAVDSGNGILTITVTPSGGAGIRGVALALTRTAGDGTVANSSKVVTTGLNTFIDYGFSVPAGFNVGVGHAAANIAAAGVATFPATNLSLCAGYLAPSAQAALTTPAVFTVDYDGTTNTTIGIALDTLRGGIVGDTLGNITVQASQTLVFALDCVKSTAPFYADWVAFGKPNCWCFRRQCHGDADGLQVAATKTVPAHWVGTPDLTILTSAWKVPTASVTSAMICADFDQTKIAATKTVPEHRVGTPDLTILTNYWKKTDAQNPECPMTNFNSWKN